MAEFGKPVANWVEPHAPGRDVMEGNWARLEPLTPALADRLHAANALDAEGRIWDYLPYGPFDIAGYRDWVAKVAPRHDPTFFAIINKQTGQPCGVMSFLRIDPKAGSIEIGHLCFAPPLQRTPAATDAVFQTMKWAFEAGYRRFEWKCDALNLPSRVAAERFGLSYEGIFRNAAVVKGRNRDTAWFAAIDSEWPRLRAAYETWLDPRNFDAAGRQKTSLADLTRPILAARDPLGQSRGGVAD